MKRLIIPLFFLITFSTSVNASPWSQMLKGGIKGGTKEVLRENKGDREDWIKTIWEKKLTDSDTRKATTIKIKYDSFTKTKTCITQPYLPDNVEVDGFLMREFKYKGAGDINNKQITIYNGPKEEVQFKFDNKDKIYKLKEWDAQPIDFALWKKYKKLRTRVVVDEFIINGQIGGDYTKTETLFLKTLDEYLNKAKKHNCKSMFERN